MKHVLAASGLLLLGAQPGAANTLMTCDVIGTRTNGEHTGIVHGTATQPAAGGGPLHIMRFVDHGQGPLIHHGAPRDGNPGTVGR